MTSAIAFLESWFLSQCDGDWEHDTRIEIATLDNPGWYLTIVLTSTDLEGLALDYSVFRDDQPSWVHCWSDGRKFEAAAGPLGFAQALEQFRIFASDESMQGRHRTPTDKAEPRQPEAPSIHYRR